MSSQPQGFKAWRVIEKTPESAVITSFVLAPQDGPAPMDFRPGQFLTVRLVLGDGTRVLRNYSVSALTDNPLQVRISVKREPAPFDRQDLPAGQGSNHLHDGVRVGDVLDIAGPSGTFVLDEQSPRPVVLFSGGVGLTPMLSMLHRLSGQSMRPVHFLHACENGAVHGFRDEVLALADRRPGIEVHFCYRNPSEADRDRFHSQGLISRQTLQSLLPLDDYDIYLCGPRLFMQANWRLLRSLGVARERIHYGVHRENGNFRTISPADSPKSLRCAVGVRMEYTSLRRQDDYSPHVRLGFISVFSDAAASTSTTST